MQKPLIGISAGAVRNYLYPWAPHIYGQSHTYVDSIIRAGGLPVILPLSDDPSVIANLCAKIDGLLLSGGNDIGPELYKEEACSNTVNTSLLRDSSDFHTLQNILGASKPVLAICRGMQFLNVYKGGTLYQHIASDLPEATNHESSTEAKELEHIAHTLEIDDTSKLTGFLKTTRLETNTHHHQAIKSLGEGLLVSARSEDGIIEAIESADDRFVIGIQSHPESLGRAIPGWNNLFKAFIAHSAKPPMVS
jgi:putative glutamine amidotransferase